MATSAASAAAIRGVKPSSAPSFGFPPASTYSRTPLRSPLFAQPTGRQRGGHVIGCVPHWPSLHTHTHTHTHTRARAHAHTHTHTRVRACTRAHRRTTANPPHSEQSQVRVGCVGARVLHIEHGGRTVKLARPAFALPLRLFARVRDHRHHGQAGARLLPVRVRVLPPCVRRPQPGAQVIPGLLHGAGEGWAGRTGTAVPPASPRVHRCDAGCEMGRAPTPGFVAHVPSHRVGRQVRQRAWPERPAAHGALAQP